MHNRVIHYCIKNVNELIDVGEACINRLSQIEVNNGALGFVAHIPIPDTLMHSVKLGYARIYKLIFLHQVLFVLKHRLQAILKVSIVVHKASHIQLILDKTLRNEVAFPIDPVMPVLSLLNPVGVHPFRNVDYNRFEIAVAELDDSLALCRFVRLDLIVYNVVWNWQQT